VEGNRATCALFDDPTPLIVFPERSFAFTGRFFYGKRSDCQAAMETRGAVCHDGPSKRTDYLVVGELGSRDWVHSTHGAKLQKAIGYRAKYGLAIVPEEAGSLPFVPGSTWPRSRSLTLAARGCGPR